MTIAIYLIILFVNKIHVYLTQNCYRIKVEDKIMVGLWAKLVQSDQLTNLLPTK